MSKKKDLKYFNDKKGSKKNKKNKRSAYDKPKFKTVKPTLSKKEAKSNKKTVLSPVEVPKEFRKNRLKCNHAARIISVEEYRNMTPTYAAYTPALERVVELFGEENVGICKDCYDVVVNRNCVTSKDVNDAAVTLYAACNVVIANRRMKDDEVKEISKLKDVLENFMPVLELMRKIEEDGSQSANSENVGSIDSVNLNRNSGALFVDQDD